MVFVDKIANLEEIWLKQQAEREQEVVVAEERRILENLVQIRRLKKLMPERQSCAEKREVEEDENDLLKKMRWQKLSCGDYLYKGFEEMVKDGTLEEKVTKYAQDQKDKNERELIASQGDSHGYNSMSESEAGPETISTRTCKKTRFVNLQKLN